MEWSAVPLLALLGIDEIALKKGHKDFVVILSGLTAQREKYILAVLPDRKKETVKAFLKTLPPRQCQSIRHVCIDMNEGYCNAVLETLPEEDYAQLKGVMWAFRKPWAALTEEQQVMLLLLFQYAPILKDVYVQREVLTGIFERRQSKAQAEQALTQWLERINALGLACFAPFITTLDNWRDKITNYFIRRETSGFVEGPINKIKVIKRRCYGIYNLGRLFQHIWLDVQGRRVLFANH
ncbi:transposase [Methylotuvimicrobium sp. KM1]|uniref:transposase n=1 Tax=Methylotuvimicrobium sp. KM1 TaxID=3377707 RepID=UPI00384B2522